MAFDALRVRFDYFLLVIYSRTAISYVYAVQFLMDFQASLSRSLSRRRPTFSFIQSIFVSLRSLFRSHHSND